MLKKFILKMFDNSTKFVARILLVFVARILLVIAAIFCLLFTSMMALLAGFCAREKPEESDF